MRTPINVLLLESDRELQRGDLLIRFAQVTLRVVEALPAHLRFVCLGGLCEWRRRFALTRLPTAAGEEQKRAQQSAS